MQCMSDFFFFFVFLLEKFGEQFFFTCKSIRIYANFITDLWTNSMFMWGDWKCLTLEYFSFDLTEREKTIQRSINGSCYRVNSHFGLMVLVNENRATVLDRVRVFAFGIECKKLESKISVELDVHRRNRVK